jgi:hypothetical protein
MPRVLNADINRTEYAKIEDVLALDGDCSKRDIEDALQNLSFQNAHRLLSIDREVRDFLLAALRRR